jgi:glycosyltransferase involved in cell wall biosynthesis
MRSFSFVPALAWVIVGIMRRLLANTERIRLTLASEFPLPGGAPAGGVEVAVSRLAPASSQRGIEVAVIAPGSVERASEFMDGYRIMRVQAASNGLFRAAPPGLAATAGGDTTTTTTITAHGIVPGHADRIRLPSSTLCEPGTQLQKHRGARRAEVVVGVHEDWRLNLPGHSCISPTSSRPPTTKDDSILSVAAYCSVEGPDALKRWDVLASAWLAVKRAVSEASLEVIGWRREGPTKLECDCSIVVGERFSSAETLEAMKRAVVLVIRFCYEVAPLVLAEARTLGVSVVARRVGGMASMADGTALLVDVDQPAMLAAALTEAFRGRERMEPLVIEVRSGAEGFTAERVAEADLQLYAQHSNAY